MSDRRGPTALPRAARGVLWFLALAASVATAGVAVAALFVLVMT